MNIRNFFRHPVVSVLIASLMILELILVMNPPNALVFKLGVDNAVRVMLFYLFLGFFFMLVGQNKLLFLSFTCCAVLCSFLKNRTDGIPEQTSLVENSSPTFSMAHFSAANINEGHQEALAMILETDPDLVSVQELSPIWASWLEEKLEGRYPYSFELPDVDIFGLALYSKIPFEKIDTFHYRNIPILKGTIRVDKNHLVELLSIQTYPALSQLDYERIKEHLELAVEETKDDKLPMLVFGQFQLVPWSNEILKFREELQLQDSRKGLLSAYPSGSLSLLNIPFDHIFHTKDIQCLYFATINSEETKQLGIIGTYQLK
ncbi:MAG: hypothetical protein KDC34_00815 [Saprospiraceae bacterium]|nr:hypothetical protein [Saprospiraceae bacterium]